MSVRLFHDDKGLVGFLVRSPHGALFIGTRGTKVVDELARDTVRSDRMKFWSHQFNCSVACRVSDFATAESLIEVRHPVLWSPIESSDTSLSGVDATGDSVGQNQQESFEPPAVFPRVFPTSDFVDASAEFFSTKGHTKPSQSRGSRTVPPEMFPTSDELIGSTEVVSSKSPTTPRHDINPTEMEASDIVGSTEFVSTVGPTNPHQGQEPPTVQVSDKFIVPKEFVSSEGPTTPRHDIDPTEEDAAFRPSSNQQLVTEVLVGPPELRIGGSHRTAQGMALFGMADPVTKAGLSQTRLGALARDEFTTQGKVPPGVKLSVAQLGRSQAHGLIPSQSKATKTPVDATVTSDFGGSGASVTSLGERSGGSDNQDRDQEREETYARKVLELRSYPKANESIAHLSPTAKQIRKALMKYVAKFQRRKGVAIPKTSAAPVKQPPKGPSLVQPSAGRGEVSRSGRTLNKPDRLMEQSYANAESFNAQADEARDLRWAITASTQSAARSSKRPLTSDDSNDESFQRNVNKLRPTGSQTGGSGTAHIASSALQGPDREPGQSVALTSALDCLTRLQASFSVTSRTVEQSVVVSVGGEITHTQVKLGNASSWDAVQTAWDTLDSGLLLRVQVMNHEGTLSLRAADAIREPMDARFYSLYVGQASVDLFNVNKLHYVECYESRLTQCAANTLLDGALEMVPVLFISVKGTEISITLPKGIEFGDMRDVWSSMVHDWVEPELAPRVEVQFLGSAIWMLVDDIADQLVTHQLEFVRLRPMVRAGSGRRSVRGASQQQDNELAAEAFYANADRALERGNRRGTRFTSMSPDGSDVVDRAETTATPHLESLTATASSTLDGVTVESAFPSAVTLLSVPSGPIDLGLNAVPPQPAVPSATDSVVGASSEAQTELLEAKGSFELAVLQCPLELRHLVPRSLDFSSARALMFATVQLWKDIADNRGVQLAQHHQPLNFDRQVFPRVEGAPRIPEALGLERGQLHRVSSRAALNDEVNDLREPTTPEVKKFLRMQILAQRHPEKFGTLTGSAIFSTATWQALIPKEAIAQRIALAMAEAHLKGMHVIHNADGKTAEVLKISNSSLCFPLTSLFLRRVCVERVADQITQYTFQFDAYKLRRYMEALEVYAKAITLTPSDSLHTRLYQTLRSAPVFDAADDFYALGEFFQGRLPPDTRQVLFNLFAVHPIRTSDGSPCFPDKASVITCLAHWGSILTCLFGNESVGSTWESLFAQLATRIIHGVPQDYDTAFIIDAVESAFRTWHRYMTEPLSLDGESYGIASQLAVKFMLTDIFEAIDFSSARYMVYVASKPASAAASTWTTPVLQRSGRLSPHSLHLPSDSPQICLRNLLDTMNLHQLVPYAKCESGCGRRHFTPRDITHDRQLVERLVLDCRYAPLKPHLRTVMAAVRDFSE